MYECFTEFISSKWFTVRILGLSFSYATFINYLRISYTVSWSYPPPIPFPNSSQVYLPFPSLSQLRVVIFKDNLMQIAVALFLFYSSHSFISVWWHRVWPRTFRKKKYVQPIFPECVSNKPSISVLSPCLFFFNQIACWKTPTQFLRSIL